MEKLEEARREERRSSSWTEEVKVVVLVALLLLVRLGRGLLEVIVMVLMVFFMSVFGVGFCTRYVHHFRNTQFRTLTGRPCSTSYPFLITIRHGCFALTSMKISM